MKTDKFKVLLYLKKSGLDKSGQAPIMGHSSIAITQIYAQITDQKIARDMERVIEKCENEKNKTEFVQATQ